MNQVPSYARQNIPLPATPRHAPLVSRLAGGPVGQRKNRKSGKTQEWGATRVGNKLAWLRSGKTKSPRQAYTCERKSRTKTKLTEGRGGARGSSPSHLATTCAPLSLSSHIRTWSRVRYTAVARPLLLWNLP
jgi:hypothetical protein